MVSHNVEAAQLRTEMSVLCAATVQEPDTIKYLTHQTTPADTVPGSPRRLGLDLAQVARSTGEPAKRCDYSRRLLRPETFARRPKNCSELCQSVRRSRCREPLPADGLQQIRLPVKVLKAPRPARNAADIRAQPARYD